MKKILFLGGAYFQCPIIKKANQFGYYTICLDNVEDNPGHKIANKSINISTTEKKFVLRAAEENNVDAVISYGTDVAIRTQAYVCDKLGLIGPSLESANILTRKHKFRAFLQDHGIQKSFFLTLNNNKQNEIIDKISTILGENNISFYVKPVDSSGGKGISCIHQVNEILPALDYAFQYSCEKTVIVEETFDISSKQLCGDGIILDSKVVFVGWGIGCYYSNINAPYAEYFPSELPKSVLDNSEKLVQDILIKANYKTGQFNLDILVDHNRRIKILEVTPRCGGNFLPQAIQFAYGIDMSLIAIKLSLGENIKPEDCLPREINYIYNLMLHSKKGGKIEYLDLPQSFPKPVKFQSYLNSKSLVSPFKTGRDYFGNAIWKLDSIKSLKKFDDDIKQNGLKKLFLCHN